MARVMGNKEKVAILRTKLFSTNYVVLISKEIENIVDFRCEMNVIP